LGLGEAPPAKVASIELPKAPSQVVDVISTRCVMCHAPEPVFEGIGEAPKGVLLDTPEHIAAFAPAIREQAVMSTAMPPNNITEMTAEERAVLAQWLKDRKVAAK
ncbi:MAG TPA: cysteine desulfurase, partial [Roseiarcus sp.]|nr:cysteine desulfurase [Roseiarcus sp.]